MLRGNTKYEFYQYQLPWPCFLTLKYHLQYLKLARELNGYGDVVFPHCACDSRKEGHVIAAVGASAFKLHACKDDGILESQVVEFQWNSIARWEVDEESMAFCFQYTRPDNRPPRWLKVFTPYVSESNKICLSDFGKNESMIKNCSIFFFTVYVPLWLLRSNSGRGKVGWPRRMT